MSIPLRGSAILNFLACQYNLWHPSYAAPQRRFVKCFAMSRTGRRDARPNVLSTTLATADADKMGNL